MNNGLRHVRKKQISLKYSQSRFCRKHVILIILNWTLIVLFLCSSKLSSSHLVINLKWKIFRVSRNPIWAPIWSKFQNSILIKNLISWASTVHVHFRNLNGAKTQRGTLERSESDHTVITRVDYLTIWVPADIIVRNMSNFELFYPS